MKKDEITFLESLPQMLMDGVAESSCKDLLDAGFIDLHPSSGGMTTACLSASGAKLIASTPARRRARLTA